MSQLTQEQLIQALQLYQSNCVDSFFGAKCWTILATAPDDSLQYWAMDCWPDFFDRQKQTARCRIWIMPDEPIENPVIRVIETAKYRDVTIQLLCTHEADETTREFLKLGGAFAIVAQMKETYPILYLASHKMKWGDA
jgi:hypothetical protein